MKTIKPSENEIKENPRSRSAILFEIINKCIWFVFNWNEYE